MFIEKLKDEEIQKFIENNIKQEFIQEYGLFNREEDRLYIRLFNGALRDVFVNDFHLYTNLEDVDTTKINFEWSNFMYQKFGNEYKQAYNENLRQQYESAMIK